MQLLLLLLLLLGLIPSVGWLLERALTWSEILLYFLGALRYHEPSLAGKVAVGLASHWPCVTDSVVYPPTAISC